MNYAISLLVEPAYKVPLFLNVSVYLRVKGLGSSCTKRMLVSRSDQKKRRGEGGHILLEAKK